ncbi:MAG: T9SS type A sorting domain-containing protein [Chitinophagales bacterium]|nr:T9SS type A sorting domain-containing protein [Chitinophagales bacterium]
MNKIFTVIFLLFSLYSQAQDTFSCDKMMYLSQDSRLYVVQTDNRTNLVYGEMFNFPIDYNGLAYNPKDNYLYAMRTVPVGASRVVQIKSDGSYQLLGPISGLPNNVTFNGGEIDVNGYYYIKENVVGNKVYKIDLETLTATTITLPFSVHIPDFAYNTTDNRFYGVVYQAPAPSNVGKVFWFDENGQGGFLGQSHTPNNFAMIGAAGEIYGITNAGGFYKFNLSTGERVFVASTPSSVRNDAAHCVTSRIDVFEKPDVQNLLTDCTNLKVDLTDAYIGRNLQTWEQLRWYKNGVLMNANEIAFAEAGVYQVRLFDTELISYSDSVQVTVSNSACLVQISGIVYNDINRNSVQDGSDSGIGLLIGTNIKPQVRLETSLGQELSTVEVNSDGTFGFSALSDSDYIIKLIRPDGTIASGWNYMSEGDGNPDGILNISLPAGNLDYQNVNFGISQRPKADAKSFLIHANAMSTSTPIGFPADPAFPYSISTANSAFNGDGSLSGSDVFDCPMSSSCNIGKMFTIESIFSKTRLYYDFGGGTGVRVLIPGDIISNFNSDKLVVYTEKSIVDEENKEWNEFGFTYSLTNSGGFKSSTVTYKISTDYPLGYLPAEIFPLFFIKCGDETVNLQDEYEATQIPLPSWMEIYWYQSNDPLSNDLIQMTPSEVANAGPAGGLGYEKPYYHAVLYDIEKQQEFIRYLIGVHYSKCPVKIRGTVFHDIDGNQIKDGVDVGMGVLPGPLTKPMVQLQDNNFNLIDELEVASDGTFEFDVVSGNLFRLVLTNPGFLVPESGWLITQRASGTNQIGIIYINSLQLGGSTDHNNADFGIQPNTFVCDENMYLSQLENTNLYNVDVSDLSNLDFVKLGYYAEGNGLGIRYNGLAYNPKDNYLYAMRRDPPSRVIKISRDGLIQVLDPVTGLPPAKMYNAGEITDDGIYFVKEENVNNLVYKIDLETMSATTITIPNQVHIPDYAYSVTDQKFYGVVIATPNSANIGKMYWFDKDGNGGFIGAKLFPTDFGAMVGAGGDIYGFSNTGGFYKFDRLTGEREFLSNSQPTNVNDAAHCVNSRLKLFEVPKVRDLDIPCGELTVDLNDAVVKIVPEFELRWFNNDVLLSPSQITSVGPGVYVARFFDTELNNYSRPVEVHVNQSKCPIRITGIVFNDANGNGVQESVEPGVGILSSLSTKPRLRLEGDTAYAEVDVTEDGTYEFEAESGNNYKISLIIPDGSPISGWAYTGEGDTLIDGVINISIPLGDSDYNNVDFGIQRPPVADAKFFNVPASVFSIIPPVGFVPYSELINGDIVDFYTISTADENLDGGYIHKGSLTGSDAEDCPDLQSCNTNRTFVIDELFPTTKLFYDFGGEKRVVMINPMDTIKNYQPDKLVIYAMDGAGNAMDDGELRNIGFRYSIVDNAHFASQPKDYIIVTDNALPVELVSFSGKIINCTSLLTWETASELNNDFFEIRKSENGVNWQTVGKVNGNGTSSLPHSYSFIDDEIYSDGVYYQLFQQDYDGQSELSKVIYLEDENCNEKIDLKLYPNPASEILKIKLSKSHGVFDILIFDALGKLVKRSLSNSSKSASFSINDLPVGTYLITLKFKDYDMVIQKHFVVQR